MFRSQPVASLLCSCVWQVSCSSPCRHACWDSSSLRRSRQKRRSSGCPRPPSSWTWSSATRRGKPVTDLTAADFELLEDDHPQTIGNVTLVAPPGTLPAGGVPASPTAAPTARSGAVPAPTFVALVFDRLSPEGRALAAKGAQAYLESARDNDFAGVFVVSNSLETIQTYTTDRAALKKGLDEAASRATANFSRNADAVAPGRLGDRIVFDVSHGQRGGSRSGDRRHCEQAGRRRARRCRPRVRGRR